MRLKGITTEKTPSTSTWFHRCQNLKSHSDCISFQNSNTVRAILTATLIKFHALKILELHTFKTSDSIYQTTRRSEARRLKPPIVTGLEIYITGLILFRVQSISVFPYLALGMCGRCTQHLSVSWYILPAGIRPLTAFLLRPTYIHTHTHTQTHTTTTITGHYTGT